MISRKVSGFTLIELMVTLAVLAVLAAIAFPNFQNVIRSNRVATTTNELLASLSFARAEAIKNAHGAGVCASTTGSSCDGEDWGSGWLIWADSNGNGSFDAGEDVLRFSAMSPQIQGAEDDLVVSFDGRGRRRSLVAQAIVLRPDECGSQELQRTISINQTGQTKVAKGACQ
jgi:type IV fimbrial biogenesis protein FimT